MTELGDAFYEHGYVRCAACEDAPGAGGRVDLSSAEDFAEARAIWDEHRRTVHGVEVGGGD